MPDEDEALRAARERGDHELVMFMEIRVALDAMKRENANLRVTNIALERENAHLHESNCLLRQVNKLLSLKLQKFRE